MERIDNPMVRPIQEVVEECENCNGSGVLDYTTCDYCKSHTPDAYDCGRCVIADIPMGIVCPECWGKGYRIYER